MSQTRRGGPRTPTDTAPTEIATSDDTPRPYGFNLPAPNKTPEELLAYADGWATGYARGQVDGFAEGFATADEVLKGAITAALGQPGDDYSAAVQRANRTLAVVQYRRQREAA